ncbi:pseudaminic acid synthase [Bacteroidota bacterium]
MQFIIGNKKIGEDSPVFIIAELSANHNNDFRLTEKTLIAMKNAGADAVKVQTYLPEDMTLDLDTPMFQTRKDTIWKGRKLFDLYKEASMPYTWYIKLNQIAKNLGMEFFSSPFSKQAVDMLEDLNVPAYKIASPEITDFPLIEYIAVKDKPVILSSGIATRSDLEDAVDIIRMVGNDKIAILKCTTAYPAPYSEINLRTIPDIGDFFNVIPGLSDHTLGTAIPVASVVLGAKIIEKHFILNRKQGGPDAVFSLEPMEFKLMVESIRNVEKALGNVNYNLTESTKKSRLVARSLFAVKDIKQGEVLTEFNIRSIRPGYGLHPKYLTKILGKKAKTNFLTGTPLSWSLIE